MNLGAAKSTKVLLIDDDLTYLNLLKIALQHEDVTIIGIKDTLLALPLFENDADILHVIVDLRMPLGKPNGISFARMAKFKRNDTKVALISGERELLNAQDAAEFGGVLAKDDGLRALVGKIRHRLGIAA